MGNTTRMRHAAAQGGEGRREGDREGGGENGTLEGKRGCNLRKMARKAWVEIGEREEARVIKEAALSLGYDEEVARECVWSDVADELSEGDMKGIREASRVRMEKARCQMLIEHGGKRRMVERFSGQGKQMKFMLRLVKNEIGTV